MLKILDKESLLGKKQENQDACLVKSFSNGDMLLAVADGMGGGVMGAELSLKTIALLDEFFEQEVEYPLTKLRQSLFMISDEMFVMLDGQKGGTTLCMAYYQNGKIFYINIGDSRVWLCRQREIINLTLDQNRYEYNLLNNLEPKEDDRRIIHNILGLSSGFEIETTLDSKEWSAIGSYELEQDDLLLLSSDGFHDFIEPQMFCEDIDENFESILSQVKEKSHDNITVVIAKEV